MEGENTTDKVCVRLQLAGPRLSPLGVVRRWFSFFFTFVSSRKGSDLPFFLFLFLFLAFL